MNPLIVIGIIAGAPILLITIFKAKASIVFLALCAGSVLTTFVGDAVLDLIQLFVRNYSDGLQVGISLALLLVPALLTILFVRGTVSGAKFVTNIILAVLTGVMTLYLAVPQLPKSIQNDIIGSSIWPTLLQYQGVLVGSAVFMSLMQLWVSGRSARHKKGKHK